MAFRILPFAFGFQEACPVPVDMLVPYTTRICVISSRYLAGSGTDFAISKRMKQILSLSFFMVITLLGWSKFQEMNVWEPSAEKEVPQVISASAGLWSLPRARSISALGNVDTSLGKSPQEIADNYLNNHREEWHIQDYHQLRAELHASPVETTVIYRVYQDQLPVLGMKIEILVGKNLEVKSVQNSYRPVRKVDFSHEPFLSAEEVIERIPPQFVADGATASHAASVLYVPASTDEPELAYTMPLQEGAPTPHPIHLLLRAADGQLLGRSVPRTAF